MHLLSTHCTQLFWWHKIPASVFFLTWGATRSALGSHAGHMARPEEDPGFHEEHQVQNEPTRKSFGESSPACRKRAC